MKRLNLWETKLKDDYIYFNNVTDYFNFLIEENRYMNFKIKKQFTPGMETEDFLETQAFKENLELIYTDLNHPIVVSQKTFKNNYVDPRFYLEHKKDFIQAAHKLFLSEVEKNNIIIKIPDFLFDDNLLNLIIETKDLKSRSYTYNQIEGKELTESQINKIKENDLEFVLNKGNKKISTKYKIGYYTKEQLNELEGLNLYIPIKEEEINNLIYVNNSTMINIAEYHNNKIGEKNFLNNIKNILEELSKHKRNYNIKISIENREILRQSKIINNLPNNISLFIETDLHTYDLETYKKEEEKLEKLIMPIRESNLSPFERYIAVYNIVKQFKEYKENEEDKEQARNLRYILDNEYIVCKGFSNLLNDLLNRVGISNKEISLAVDTSYDEGFTLEETPVQLAGHGRNLIRIKDEKYNIDGIYVCDSTWDNDLKEDLYLNCLMTFDRKKEATRLEFMAYEDYFLDFHSIDEFNAKMNLLIKKEIKKQEEYKFTDSKEKLIINVYKKIYNIIMQTIYKLDLNIHSEFLKKYNEIITTTTNFNELENACSQMFTEYAHYILPLINKNVDFEDILTAAMEVKRKINGINNDELKEWLENTIKTNVNYEINAFPYTYNPENKKEAYLEENNRGLKF